MAATRGCGEIVAPLSRRERVGRAVHSVQCNGRNESLPFPQNIISRGGSESEIHENETYADHSLSPSLDRSATFGSRAQNAMISLAPIKPLDSARR